MERFKRANSLAGILQPGDGTRYEMVAIETFNTIEVIVCNDSFFDQIIFNKDYKTETDPYYTRCGKNTNPWTIKAAKEMRDRLLTLIKEGCI